MSDPCLHCMIFQVINDYFADRGDVHGDQIVIDAEAVAQAAVHILADMLSSIDDDAERNKAIMIIGGMLVQKIIAIRDAGAQPDTLRPC